MITIVDYQMGNLRSVQKAIQHNGGEALITDDPGQIANAEKLILPGVGAFGDAMKEIRDRDLVSPIKDFIATGRPFFGICLGLQLLFDRGFEHGEHEGLGVIPGDVVRFDIDPSMKVPHMGWNSVRKTADAPVLADVADDTHFYFVHSYYVRPASTDVVSLNCEYGIKFCAAVWKDNVFATQFHPEKSQTQGLALLAAFDALKSPGESHQPAS
ncbi:MAG: imidazole glycerol phosphate synthase subunit HisH [Planctomycetota bacterium]